MSSGRDWTPLDFRSARVRARLTQGDLARHLGITQSTISRFEEGTLNLTPSQQISLIELILKKQKELDGTA